MHYDAIVIGSGFGGSVAAHKKHKSQPASAKKHASSASHAKTPAKHGKTTARRKGRKNTATWRSRQTAPTPDRYKEIQSALASRGYLHAEPNGVWDSDSTDALRLFQKDQNLEPSGTGNSLSLIGLVLGPKRPAAALPAAPSPAKPVSPAAAPSPSPAVETPAVAPANPAPATPATQQPAEPPPPTSRL